MESTGSTLPESPSDIMGPVGQSKGTYFIVIALVGFVMSMVPTLFSFEFTQHILPSYVGQSPFSYQVLIQAMNFVTFLISPCLFFVILYIYGKGTTHHFNESYLMVILYLFLGTALGYAAAVLFSWLLRGEELWVLNGIFWLEFTTGIVYAGISRALVGFAALGLSYLRTRNPPAVS